MSVSTASPVAEFVKLGYGDSHDLPVRCLQFHTETIGDFDTLAECLRMPGQYNAYEPERVIEAIEPLFASLSGVEFGREYSVCLYAYVPHWSHQSIAGHWGEDNRGMGDPLGDEAMQVIAAEFFEAMALCEADELGCITADGYVAWQSGKPFDFQPYRLRVWWD